MRRFILAIFGTLIFGWAFASNELDSLITKLEYEMDRRDIYDLEKEQQIRDIKNLKNDKDISDQQIYIINSRLIKEYEAYIFDSALSYLEANLKISRKLNDKILENKANLSLAYLLASSGRNNEAVDILQSIEKHILPENLLPDYYAGFRKIYSILSFYTPVNDIRNNYEKLYQDYTDSLLLLVDENSELALSLIETRLRDSRKLEECLLINSKRLAQTHLGERDYSLITFERALAYELMDDVNNRKKYLILSAISDIKSSVKDNASLAVLAGLLYKEQKLEKAYHYITFSYEDASKYNSNLRFTLISNILPIINDAYQLRNSKQKKALRGSLLAISLLSIGLLITSVLIYLQIRKLSRAQKELKAVNNQLRLLNTDLNEANSKLNESNRVKEHYIGNFLSICSNYIDKLDDYRKMVNKHLVNRQISELYEKSKSVEFIDQETKEFYDNFDTIFLHIFPNFVERMNALLLDEEKIELKNDEILNTELRIFALIRLGISDSTQIATLLRYSVRTIYNYRVKIKNKAKVPRDDFEDYIMKIGAFSK